MPKPRSIEKLLAEMDELRARLSEAEETLHAIRSGAVDALIVQGPAGEQVFTLKGADQTYRALVEAMNEGAVTLSDDGVILYCNERFADIVQTPLEQVLGKNFFQFIRVGWRERFYELLAGDAKRHLTAEVLLRTADDKEVFAHLSSNPFPLEDRIAISLVVTDITARKEAEEALRNSEERFQTVALTISDAIWDWDVLRKTTWRSRGFYTLFKHPPQKVGSDFEWWTQRIHPDDRERVLAKFNQFLDRKQPFYVDTYRFRRGDGIFVDVEDRASALYNERGLLCRVIGALSDITEQKKAEEAKRDLSRNVLNAQEQERRRVARELHDGVNQLLSSSKYRLHAIEQQLALNNKPMAKKISQTKGLIDKAISEVRLISRNLRPSELDDLGLAAALRSLADEFQERTEVTVDLKTSFAEHHLSEVIELTVYRIVQEALNNVEKHAGATRVAIHASGQGAMLALMIRDDGRGFDPATIRKTRKSGWGLANMRERVSYVGGMMAVKSVPKKGTEIALQIPI